MRGTDHVGQLEQRVVGRGLLREHVEGGARDMTRLKRFRDGRLIDQAAARAIDHASAFFHFLERGRIDDVARLVGERCVQRDEIGAREQLVEIDLLDAEIHGALM